MYAGAEADADRVGLDGAVDDVEDGGVEVAEGAALEAADAGAGDGRRRLGDKVAAVDVPGAVGPDQRVLGVSGVGDEALGRRAGADLHEAGEVKGAELHVGHGDVERAQLGRQDLGEGRQRGADGGLGGVEGRVDGRDDGRGEDEDLGRDPFLADGVEPGREQRQEGLDGEDGLQQGLDGSLVLNGVAHNEDDEAAPLHVERQRLGQRQPGRAGNDNDLGAAAILAALGPADLAHVLVLLVALVGDGAGDDDGGADEVLVARDPALQLLERRQRHDDDLGLGRGQRLDDVGQPVDRGQALADGLGGLVDALVDELGGIVRDAPEVARDARQLEG
ncbi:hypothetical protein CCMA1212_005047 [Trichoderma ghanense]|uniref:Uncharacterized protein n=1 Tax=Trichoderma ghanense TaxID=65468 RepID=A0ABY2H3A7_9HYPO